MIKIGIEGRHRLDRIDSTIYFPTVITHSSHLHSKVIRVDDRVYLLISPTIYAQEITKNGIKEYIVVLH